jgi:hypothetical protein
MRLQAATKGPFKLGGLPATIVYFGTIVNASYFKLSGSPNRIVPSVPAAAAGRHFCANAPGPDGWRAGVPEHCDTSECAQHSARQAPIRLRHKCAKNSQKVMSGAELSGGGASVYFSRPASVGKGFQSSIATSLWLGWCDDKRFPRDPTRCMAA